MRKVTITFLTDWEDEADVKAAVLDIINSYKIAELLPECDEPMEFVKHKIAPFKPGDES
jgi:hypothetical protein